MLEAFLLGALILGVPLAFFGGLYIGIMSILYWAVPK